MDRVDWFFYDREDEETRNRTIANRPEGDDPAHVIGGKAAAAVGKPLTGARRDEPGLAVHYGLRILPGALYGALGDRVEAIGAGLGWAYGATMFLTQDELLNTALGTAGRHRVILAGACAGTGGPFSTGVRHRCRLSPFRAAPALRTRRTSTAWRIEMVPTVNPLERTLLDVAANWIAGEDLRAARVS